MKESKAQQEGFVEHCLPVVRRTAAKWFGRVKDRDRQADLRQEAECLAWQEWMRAIERGWDVKESAVYIALTSVRRAWRGSRLVGRPTTGGCPLDHNNRQRGGVAVLSLNARVYPHEQEDEYPVEDGRYPDPSILGALHVDWDTFSATMTAAETHYVAARLSGQTLREIGVEQCTSVSVVHAVGKMLLRRWLEYGS